ncbi:hypothetical protein MAMP_00584 [Methylophaga aminisulfidivorans MP]|uniref:Uncharacterized protein n=1 Tax=Methylophaga aminisulfidivorans MP TaxID=1026882 RepID=F5T318_9GAMM|nr:hypothetical protein MAMP_00584 [Methylophaga aminisulfidivorans MP]
MLSISLMDIKKTVFNHTQKWCDVYVICTKVKQSSSKNKKRFL